MVDLLFSSNYYYFFLFCSLRFPSPHSVQLSNLYFSFFFLFQYIVCFETYIFSVLFPKHCLVYFSFPYLHLYNFKKFDTCALVSADLRCPPICFMALTLDLANDLGINLSTLSFSLNIPSYESIGFFLSEP